MKRKLSDLTETEKIRTLDALYTTASSVRGRKAMKAFLRDLLTESERVMLGRRILIAHLLLKNESSLSIRSKTGAGLATIQRVHHWLKDQLPGYEDAIQGMEEEYLKRSARHAYAINGLYRLKKKYPLHFLFFPLPKQRKN
jgi:uncharacterized protein YerC